MIYNNEIVIAEQTIHLMSVLTASFLASMCSGICFLGVEVTEFGGAFGGGFFKIPLGINPALLLFWPNVVRFGLGKERFALFSILKFIH
jgi:hypothetical protein